MAGVAVLINVSYEATDRAQVEREQEDESLTTAKDTNLMVMNYTSLGTTRESQRKRSCTIVAISLQGYLAHKKYPPRRTLL